MRPGNTVGDGGEIAHYDDPSRQSYDSITELDLTNIYGYNQGYHYAAGVDIAFGKGVIVKGDQKSGNWNVMIEGDIIDSTELFDKLYGSFGALWIDEKNYYSIPEVTRVHTTEDI